MQEIIHYIEVNQALMVWMVWLSLLFFFVSLAVVPFFIVRIPADYFNHTKHRLPYWKNRHPIIRVVLIVVKNFLGMCLLIIGIVLLFMPGQGVLTILVGLLLLDFPGKYTLECNIVRRPSVLRAINWIRKRSGKPLIIIDK